MLMSASTPPERSPEAPKRASARAHHYTARLTEAVHQASGDREGGLLDRATIVQLRDSLTLEMRESLIDAFATSLPKCLTEISSAAERGDHVELRRVAHLLKGSAATLGASRLTLTCQRLEHSGRDRDPAVNSGQLDEVRSVASEAREALREQLLSV